MTLNNLLVSKAKPKEKAYKLKDERGLYLEISPSGGKWWRLRYWFRSKENRLSLGTYPEISLAEARKRRDEARVMLANGVDPAAVRKGEKAATTDSFEAIAREWHVKFSPTWTPDHAETIISRLELNAFPWLGAQPIREIGAPEVLAVLRRVESRGALETAHRVRGIIGQVFRYAVATGRADRDPTGDLRGALPPAQERHHASITDSKGVADLLRTIEGYKGSFVTLCALRLAPLVFVRPGELRKAEWAEMDLDAAEWRIPAERMKLRRLHLVPLSRQAVAILRDLHPLTGSGRLVFPGLRSAERPMSENTVNAALRRLGYSREEMTGHGFRSMASTILNEQGWTPDAIERQLAHAERNSIRGAYNYAEHLPERRKMMQAWADYLDGLKAGGKIIPIHREAEGQ